MENNLDLVISGDTNNVKIVSLLNGVISDYIVNSEFTEYCVGDILVGKVKKKALGLNSFFVTFNSAIDGFMHFSDLTEMSLTTNSFCSDLLAGKNVKVSTYEIDKREANRVSFDYGYTSEYIQEGDVVLVQVIKEPIFNKGPRLSGRITLAGDFVILVVFSNEIKLSRKISDNVKRSKMMSILTSLREDLQLNNFGIILRTSAETFINFDNVNEAKKILFDDIISLLKTWSKCIDNIKNAQIGTKILSANNIVLRVIQDKLKEKIRNIWVDDEVLYSKLKNNLKGLIKDSCALKLYKNDVVSLFSYRNIDKQLRVLFNKTVKFADGCYLIIEVTEAMNVIDVNSGGILDKFADQEELSLNVNLLAIKEIVRQIKLRDMGGIISIDFIDLKLQKNKTIVYEIMKEMLHEEKSNTIVLPLSRFNIMQITRQRVRPIVKFNDEEKCPTCHGSGNIMSSINIENIIEGEIRAFLKNTSCYRIDIYLNPLLHSYFSVGMFSKRMIWGIKFFKSITLHSDCQCMLNIVKIYNRRNFLKKIEI